MDSKNNLRKRLLAWYDRNQRNLPWRKNINPYRTWISEIMLQQTTVASVGPRYESFLSEFPDVKTLAAAPEEKVLGAWAGLGYYSRARNLRLAAQKIVADHDGRFPDTLGQALDLPGIGRYTAGAILSIAYDKPTPLVDGNVARVFARIFAIDKPMQSADVQKKLWALAESFVDGPRPGDWNQALMELGATVCLPKNPKCSSCPVENLCQARKLGRELELPKALPRQRWIDVSWTCLWIEKDASVLLYRRPKTERFLKNHWGFPEPEHLPGLKIGELIKKDRHTITNHKIALELRKATPPKHLPKAARWIEKEKLGDYLVSSLWRKLLR